MNTSASPVSSLVDLAYARLGQNIAFLDYAPGQHLEEKQLMADLGLGRTPIREALLRLSADMVVERRPKSGYFVRDITLQSTKAAFDALYLLESGLADLAVRHDCTRELETMRQCNETMHIHVEHNNIRELVEANEAFHAGLARCTRNEFLVQALARVRTEIKRLSYLSFSQDVHPDHSLQGHYHGVLQEHRAMLDALSARKAQTLRDLLTSHTKTFQQRIMHTMMT